MDQRAYGGPLRYVQGPGVIADVGRYAAPLADKALLLMDGFVEDTYGEMLRASLAAAGVTPTSVRFGGESTDAEVRRCGELGREAGA